MRHLCLPPYGCNLASAGLLLGLFISARREKLAFNLGGHDINPSNWVSQAFGNRTLLQLEVLDKTQVRLIKQDESDAWQKLLAEWEVAPAHVDKLDWSKKALALKQTINVPGILLDRYQLMEEHTRQAKAALEDWETRCLSLHRDFEEAYEHKHAGNLSRWGMASPSCIQNAAKSRLVDPKTIRVGGADGGKMPSGRDPIFPIVAR